VLLLAAAATIAAIGVTGFWLHNASQPQAPSVGLAVGATAPSIRLPATTGEALSLDLLRGSKVVLYFYEASG